MSNEEPSEIPDFMVIDTSKVETVTWTQDEVTGWINVMFGDVIIPMHPFMARLLGHQVYEAGVKSTEAMLTRMLGEVQGGGEGA